MTNVRFLQKFSAGVAAMACAAVLIAQPALAQNAPSAPEASPEVYKILAENAQFRVIEATWLPGQEDNFHNHPADRVSLYKTDCKLRLSKPDGTYRDASPKGGTAAARTGKPVPSHKAKNIGGNVCIIRIVELK